MSFLRRVFFFVILPAAALRSAPAAFPLQDGEHLTYRVSWAVVMGAGEIKIDAHRDAAANDSHLVVTTMTATRGVARWLLPFDATASSVFDLRTGKLVSLHEETTTRGKKAEHNVTFDYAAHRAIYTVPGGVEAPRTLTLPEGDPMDLIIGLLQTRTWDIKEGEARDALVLFDDDFYELTIHGARYEDVKTKLGTFKTLVLEPRMEKTPPKGMFKRGSSVRVWIAQDSRRLPVKFEVEFKIGTGTATLDSYTPPKSPEAAPKSENASAPATSPARPDEKNPRP
jgi:hypothetical protein